SLHDALPISKKIVSVKTVKDGGVAVALAKMAFGNGLGAEISLDENLLLTKNIGSLIIESETLLEHRFLQEIGIVNDSSLLKINDSAFKINDLLKVSKSTFKELFSTQEKEKIVVEIDEKLNSTQPRNIFIKKHGIAKPRVFAPIFPGTNCEYETQNAFRKEGADVH